MLSEGIRGGEWTGWMGNSRSHDSTEEPASTRVHSPGPQDAQVSLSLCSQ